jgi:hypothetical protein
MHAARRSTPGGHHRQAARAYGMSPPCQPTGAVLHASVHMPVHRAATTSYRWAAALPRHIHVQSAARLTAAAVHGHPVTSGPGYSTRGPGNDRAAYQSGLCWISPFAAPIPPVFLASHALNNSNQPIVYRWQALSAYHPSVNAVAVCSRQVKQAARVPSAHRSFTQTRDGQFAVPVLSPSCHRHPRLPTYCMHTTDRLGHSHTTSRHPATLNQHRGCKHMRLKHCCQVAATATAHRSTVRTPTPLSQLAVSAS